MTDLAFHTSFAGMVAAQQEVLTEQFQQGNLDFDVTRNDGDFKSTTDALAMLDADQEEFEQENVFREVQHLNIFKSANRVHL